MRSFLQSPRRGGLTHAKSSVMGGCSQVKHGGLQNMEVSPLETVEPKRQPSLLWAGITSHEGLAPAHWALAAAVFE